MKTKKFLTANLKPGMVSAEAAYTYNNHLVIQSNTTLTPDIIDKLKYYAVKAVKIYITEDGEPDIASENKEISLVSPPSLDIDGSTYFERVQQSEEFSEFKEIFTSSVDNFKEELNDIVVKNGTDTVTEMLHEVDNTTPLRYDAMPAKLRRHDLYAFHERCPNLPYFQHMAQPAGRRKGCSGCQRPPA